MKVFCIWHKSTTFYDISEAGLDCIPTPFPCCLCTKLLSGAYNGLNPYQVAKHLCKKKTVLHVNWHLAEHSGSRIKWAWKIICSLTAVFWWVMELGDLIPSVNYRLGLFCSYITSLLHFCVQSHCWTQLTGSIAQSYPFCTEVPKKAFKND